MGKTAVLVIAEKIFRDEEYLVPKGCWKKRGSGLDRLDQGMG